MASASLPGLLLFKGLYYEYSEKLKDPRWQKKRLEILNRDNFKCQNCNKKDKELQVHHLTYLKDCEPWEYQEYCLITLCVDCHTQRTVQDLIVKCIEDGVEFETRHEWKAINSDKSKNLKNC